MRITTQLLMYEDIFQIHCHGGRFKQYNPRYSCTSSSCEKLQLHSLDECEWQDFTAEPVIKFIFSVLSLSLLKITTTHSRGCCRLASVGGFFGGRNRARERMSF